jgi:hypothetical protein
MVDGFYYSCRYIAPSLSFSNTVLGLDDMIPLHLILGCLCVAPIGDDAKALALSDAVTTRPEWLKGPAPFDLNAYFTAPPPDKNAAPLYLEALAEFSIEMAECLPQGEARDLKLQTVKERLARYYVIAQALRKDPSSVVAEQIDEVLADYAEGFRKLAEAQRRGSCVFETGLDVTARLPHAQTARTVARIAVLRVRRSLENGDLDRAIADCDAMLRFARDLQPRGFIIQQLCGVGVIQEVTNQMIAPVLSAPGLKVEHCDRLLSMLRRHEEYSLAIDVEGYKAEYVMTRMTLHALIHDQAKLAKAYDVPPGGSVVKAVAEPVVTAVLSSGNAADSAVRETPPPWPVDADAIVAQSTPAELSAAVDKLNAFYRVATGSRNKPIAERLGALPEPVRVMPGDDPLTRALRGLTPATGAFTFAVGRLNTMLHASECHVILRRWALVHGGLPPDLVSAARDAGLTAVPTDPFDGKALRLAVPGAVPVIYSVGADGADDGGLKEARSGNQPGDLVFPVPGRGEPK